VNKQSLTADKGGLQLGGWARVLQLFIIKKTSLLQNIRQCLGIGHSLK